MKEVLGAYRTQVLCYHHQFIVIAQLIGVQENGIGLLCKPDIFKDQPLVEEQGNGISIHLRIVIKAQLDLLTRNGYDRLAVYWCGQ